MQVAPNDSLKQSHLLGIAIILVLIWGSAYTIVDVGVRYMTPIWLVAYRLIIGAVLVTAYVLVSGEKLPKLSDRRWLWYFSLGMSGSVIPFFLLTTGQVHVDSGLTSIIVGAMPLMTIVLAHFFTQEKLNWQKSLGFIIGFCGIIVLFLPDDLSLQLVKNWKSQLMIVGGAGCYAVTTVAAKRAPQTQSSVGAAMMLICAACVGFIWACLTEPADLTTPLPGLLSAIALGVGSTALATILYLYVIQKTGPSMVARINYFVPATSVIFGVWLLDEPFTGRTAFAFIVIGLGVMISRIKPSRV